MSREDCETRGILLNPYIEIGRGFEPLRNFGINVSTFNNSGCSNHLIPSFTDKGPTYLEGQVYYSVYGTVGRTVTTVPHGQPYLNIVEPPISRTLMGFLLEENLKKHLPKLHNILRNQPINME